MCKYQLVVEEIKGIINRVQFLPFIRVPIVSWPEKGSGAFAFFLTFFLHFFVSRQKSGKEKPPFQEAISIIINKIKIKL